MADAIDIKHSTYYCMKCLLHFPSEERLKQHNEDFKICNSPNQPAKLILPKPENAYIEVKNYKKQMSICYICRL